MPTTNLLALVMVMVAVIATLLYDVLVNLRGRRAARSTETAAHHHARLPIAQVDAPRPRVIPPPAEPVPARPMRPALPVTELAGRTGDPDPIRELADRLAALRILGLDHVRAHHPLFRTAGATTVAPAAEGPAIVLRDEQPEASRRPGSRARRRRPHPGIVRAAGTAPLRLVVDRGQTLQ
jgi:hypothetical protein